MLEVGTQEANMLTPQCVVYIIVSSMGIAEEPYCNFRNKYSLMNSLTRHNRDMKHTLG